nr:double-strand break repair protein AddB [Acidomonas methanolica]
MAGQIVRIASVPAGLPFLDEIAARWEERRGPGGFGDGMILVPGRRAARALVEAFLRRLDGRAALLPRIVAIGDVDEDEVTSFGAAAPDLPPAVEPERRLAVLAMLVLRAGDAFAATPTVDQAWPLARALAELMDEAERAGVDLRAALPDAADPRFAAHWAKTLEFLRIVTEAWPLWLDEQGMMNPVARSVALLHAQAAAWRASPPGEPVWAVGFADGFDDVCAVLGAVAAAPLGQVVLPGVDFALAEEVWDALPDTHPQAGVRRVLAALGVAREEVARWGHEDVALRARGRLVSDMMLPAGALDAWGRERTPFGLEGLARLDAPDQQQEAAAIAMILRDGLSRAGRRVALVTPDRALARRVATELLRYGVVADDSAGEPLALTPPAVFLRLLAEAVARDFAPVALLALLKHPLAGLGMTPGNCRASARRLERMALRGPAPPPGLAGIRAALAAKADAGDRPEAETADRPDQPEALPVFLDRLDAALRPVMVKGSASLPDLLTGLVRAAEALAATDTRTGAERLWSGAEGHALSRLMAGLIVHTAILPEQERDQLPAFLLSVFAGRMVFGQKVLRGREGEAVNPRVAILGVLEARLHAADLVVLGGLNEGIWPPATDPGPWLSRPMRRRAGLPSPERMIGASAHDFTAALLSAPEVVLSAPARREGAPAVPARWLVRLDALLGGRGQSVPLHPAQGWQALLDQPDGPARPVAAPAPRPPVALRPRRLSVTEIETWLRDPYAIHARHVLGLTALPALEEAADRSDIGLIVHEGLDAWLKRGDLREDSLRAAFGTALEARSLRPALAAWWRVRLGRIAEWVAERERMRAAAGGAPVLRALEVRGRHEFAAPGGTFSLTGRADRIEIGADGRATIIDYKTGALPSVKDVEAGWSSQLVLEAAMLAEGAFGGLPPAATAALLYWRLTGDRDRGEERAVPKNPADLPDLVARSMGRLRERVAAFDREETPYRAHPHPGQAPRYTDYALLARVPEWSVAREEDGA